jgi:hypothetical protein
MVKTTTAEEYMNRGEAQYSIFLIRHNINPPATLAKKTAHFRVAAGPFLFLMNALDWSNKKTNGER